MQKTGSPSPVRLGSGQVEVRLQPKCPLITNNRRQCCITSSWGKKPHLFPLLWALHWLWGSLPSPLLLLGPFHLRPCLCCVCLSCSMCLWTLSTSLRPGTVNLKGERCLKLLIPWSLISLMKMLNESGHLRGDACFMYMQSDGPFGQKPLQCPFKLLYCWADSWLLPELIYAAPVQTPPQSHKISKAESPFPACKDTSGTMILTQVSQ